MKYLFLEYPKCSTCQKAKQWLIEHQIDFEARHIVESNPTAEELATWYHQSGLPLKSFFNTSGLLYKSMELRDKLPQMSEMEHIKVLSTNGMLVKRPLIVGNNVIIPGFKPDLWSKFL